MNASASSDPAEEEFDLTGDQPAYPGAIAGAVLRSARLSAGASEAQLAASIGVSENTLSSWEAGTQPLASAPAPVIARVEAALTADGAEPALVADLTVAAWCDLVILAIGDAQDLNCLLVDSLATRASFRELLAWSVADEPPARYRPYVSQRRLIPVAGLKLVTEVVRTIDLLQRGAETLAYEQGNDVT
jgi:transcriptional regulator with XRE-family HTH domain